jgi:ribosome maturation factor RimP
MSSAAENIIARVEELAGPILEREGFELVETQYRREQKGWVLRLFIDRSSDEPSGDPSEAGAVGSGVTLDDCVQASRSIGRLLEVEDVPPGNYTLEVSSPGLDRPLNRPEHFKRFAGKKIKILYTEPEGRRKITGRLLGFENDVIRIEVDGREVTVSYPQVQRVNLAPEVDWNRL